jgi:hypothetical protein
MPMLRGYSRSLDPGSFSRFAANLLPNGAELTSGEVRGDDPRASRERLVEAAPSPQHVAVVGLGPGSLSTRPTAAAFQGIPCLAMRSMLRDGAASGVVSSSVLSRRRR